MPRLSPNLNRVESLLSVSARTVRLAVVQEKQAAPSLDDSPLKEAGIRQFSHADLPGSFYAPNPKQGMFIMITPFQKPIPLITNTLNGLLRGSEAYDRQLYETVGISALTLAKRRRNGYLSEAEAVAELDDLLDRVECEVAK